MLVSVAMAETTA